MFVSVQTPQYIVRNQPLYGLRDADGYSNATHIICKFVRALSNTDAPSDTSGKNRDDVDKNKIMNLKEPRFMYPIYSDEPLVTASQGKFAFYLLII